jgi:hypothetical protein
MSEKYYEALKDLTSTYLSNIKRLKTIRPVIEAFENSPDFTIEYVSETSMSVIPVNKKISAKDLSISIDEVLFDLLSIFEVDSETLDNRDLGILFKYRKEFGYFRIWVRVAGASSCRLVEVLSKTRFIEVKDKVFMLMCEEN